MDRRLCGIPFTKARVDDILVSGKDDAEHVVVDNLRAVFQRLKDAGLTLNKLKCQFMCEEVTYCGYMISRKGVRPMAQNVEAVKGAPAPTNVSELRAFLGMLQYYHSYIPQLATVTEALHRLLRKEVKWDWSLGCQEAFTKVKLMLCEAPVLTHFDLALPIVVHCDASKYGVGAVISHVMRGGEERPVAFASRTLNAAERNYATIEKEGLALVFAVKKFHQFLFGNRFTLVTDHKPLLGLFSENHPIPPRAAGLCCYRRMITSLSTVKVLAMAMLMG